MTHIKPNKPKTSKKNKSTRQTSVCLAMKRPPQPSMLVNPRSNPEVGSGRVRVRSRQLTRLAPGPGVSWDAGAAMRTRADAPVQAGQRAFGCGGAVRVKSESCGGLSQGQGWLRDLRVRDSGVKKGFRGSRNQEPLNPRKDKSKDKGRSLLGCR